MTTSPPGIDGSAPEHGTVADAPAFAPLRFDSASYRHFVDDFDLTDHEKEALLYALWSVFSSFADVGFRRHPVQQALHVSKPRGALAADSGDVLACAHTFNEQSNDKTPLRKRRRGRRKDSSC